MSKVCNDLRASEADHQNHEFWKQQRAEAVLSNNYSSGDIENMPWWAQLYQSLTDKFGDYSTITQKDLDKALNRYVKNKDERIRAKLLMNINAILKNNTLLREHLWKDITYENIERSSLMRLKNWDPETDNKVVKINGEDVIVPRLEKMSLPMLNWVYNYAYGWHTAGSEKLNIAPGILGTLQLEILTPRSIEKRDAVGAIRKARLATEPYADKAQEFELNYWEVDPQTGKRGFRQLLQAVGDLANPRTGIDKKTLHYMFHYLPQGRIVIDKDTGQVLHKKDYLPTDERHEDGNIRYEWQNAEILLSETGKPVVLDTNIVRGEVESPYDIFINAVREGQDIYERIANDVAQYVKNQNKEYKKLQKRVDNGEIPEEILESITPFYYEGEEGNSIAIDGFNTVSKKIRHENRLEGYSHVSYLKEQLPVMIDQAIREMDNRRAEFETELESGKADGSLVGKENKNKRKILRRRIIDLKKKVKRMNDLNDGITGVSSDPFTGQLLLGRQTVKSFKELNIMFRREDQRHDKLVIRDYLNGIGKTLARNDVTIEILNAIADTKSEGVQDYIHELYKTTFHLPDLKSSFFGIPTDMITFTKLLNKAPFLNIPLDMAQRMLKVIGAYQIANLLSGMLAGPRNWTATINKIHDGGVDKVIDAMQELEGENANVWRARAERAGIINFTKYIEGWVSQRLRPEERQAARYAMAYYRDYMADLKKAKNFTGKERLYKKFKKRLVDLKLSYNIESKVDAAAQWSVTHNTSDIELLEIEKHERKKGRGKQYGSKIGSARKGFKILMSGTKQFKSIQDTEGYVRTLSYIMGVKAAVEAGHAIHYDDPAAQEYGVEYTYRSDHGLSQQHLGWAYRGALGNLNTKLKYWSTQRFGREFRIMRDAWRNIGNYHLDENMDAAPARGQKFMKSMHVLNSLFNPLGWVPGKQKALREVNPQLAAFRSFMAIQGSATFIVDYLLFMPGGGFLKTGLKKLFWRNQTLKAGTGLTSDLVSLIFGLGWQMGAGILAYNDREEDEDFSEFMKRMLRHTHLGILPTQAVSLLFSLASDNEDEKIRNKRDAITPMIPLGNTGVGVLEDIGVIEKAKNK